MTKLLQIIVLLSSANVAFASNEHRDVGGVLVKANEDIKPKHSDKIYDKIMKEIESLFSKSFVEQPSKKNKEPAENASKTDANSPKPRKVVKKANLKSDEKNVPLKKRAQTMKPLDPRKADMAGSNSISNHTLALTPKGEKANEMKPVVQRKRNLMGLPNKPKLILKREFKERKPVVEILRKIIGRPNKPRLMLERDLKTTASTTGKVVKLRKELQRIKIHGGRRGGWRGIRRPRSLIARETNSDGALGMANAKLDKLGHQLDELNPKLQEIVSQVRAGKRKVRKLERKVHQLESFRSHRMEVPESRFPSAPPASEAGPWHESMAEPPASERATSQDQEAMDIHRTLSASPVPVTPRLLKHAETMPKIHRTLSASPVPVTPRLLKHAETMPKFEWYTSEGTPRERSDREATTQMEE